MHERCADPQNLLRAVGKLANVLGLALASSMLGGVRTDLLLLCYCSNCKHARWQDHRLHSTNSIDEATCKPTSSWKTTA